MVALPLTIFEFALTVGAVASKFILDCEALGPGQGLSRRMLHDLHPHPLRYLCLTLTLIQHLLGWVQTQTRRTFFVHALVQSPICWDLFDEHGRATPRFHHKQRDFVGTCTVAGFDAELFAHFGYPC